MHRPVFTAVLLLASATLVGCATGAATPTAGSTFAELPYPEPDRLTAAELDALTAAQTAQARDRLLQDEPGIDVPEVVRERFVSLSEVSQVMADCLTAEGSPTVVTKDGWESDGDITDTRAWHLATYTCAVRYPRDPVYDKPWNEEQLNYLYWYFVDVATPCLEPFAEISAPPSVDEFIAEYPDTWNPFEQAGAAGLAVTEQCPAAPEGIYGADRIVK